MPSVPAGERPLTPVPMVGRVRQLEVLTGIWERVVAEGRPHLVTVFGPAGIGKSRLSLELMEHVGSQDARVLRGRSMPYGSSSPYGPFAQHVKQVARVYDSDELPEARAKLDAAVTEIVGAEAAAEHAAHLALLIGLGENGDVGDRETLFFSARILVESLAAEGPALLLFEDIHWADPSLLDLLETLAARVREVPVLFLALARPELLNERPGVGGWPARLYGPPPRSTHRGRRAGAREAPARKTSGAGGSSPHGRGDRGGQSTLHRGAGCGAGREIDRRCAGAPDEHSGDRRGPPRRAARG